MKLQTHRLILRELLPDDVRFIADLLSDPDVMRYWPRPYTREEAGAWIDRQRDRYARHGCGYWLAVEKTTNQPVGQAGVMMIEVEGVEQPTLGWIIHRSFWRKGFATEAAHASIDFIFDVLQHDQAVALIRPENLPSIALASKLGLQPRGDTVHADLPHRIYSMQRAERAW